jgi:tripartite-type tricarboxylate transporter receptor subunit TctC
VTLYWNRIFNALLADPGFIRRLAQQNVEAAPPAGPEALADLLRSDLARWQQLVREANITI